jgi:hypothetical protein
MAVDPNDFRPGDTDNNVLRKILDRLREIFTGGLSLNVSDVEIGAVELKDADTDSRAKITNAAPSVGDFGLVVYPVGGAGGGDASAANQVIGNASLASIDGKTPALGQALMAASVPVAIASDQSAIPVTGTFFQATQPVSAASLPLPTGAATETTLAALNAKIPASPATDRATAAAPFSFRLSDGAAFYDATKTGQLPAVLVGGRLDVNIGASSATVPVSGAFFQATQPVSGTVAVSDPFLLDATFTGRINTLGQKVMASSTPVVLSSDQSSIPVTVGSLPLPSGAATETTLAAINTKIPASPATDRATAAAPFSNRLSDGAAFYDATKTGQLPTALVSGRLDVNIGASGVTVPVSGAFFQATQPISAAALPLPSGAATETTLGTRLAEATFTARINTQGQKAMAASTPVVLASDQSAIPVTQSGTWNIGSITTLPSIPTGANTIGAVTQASGPWTTNQTQWAGTAVDTNSGNLSAGTLRVTLATNQATLTNALPVTTKTALTASAPAAGSVGVASAQLVASAATRKGLVLVNTSVATVSLGFGAAAVLNSGITLLPGDSWSMDEYCFSTGAINAIASVAASNVAVQEFTT